MLTLPFLLISSYHKLEDSLNGSDFQSYLKKCEVLEFRAGSVIATARMSFESTSGVTPDKLKADIVAGISAISTTLAFDDSSISVTCRCNA